MTLGGGAIAFGRVPGALAYHFSPKGRVSCSSVQASLGTGAVLIGVHDGTLAYLVYIIEKVRKL